MKLWNNIFRKIFPGKFPLYRQANIMDCGPTCLQMVSAFFGRFYNIETLRKLSGLSNTGVTLLGLRTAAKALGFKADGVRVTLDQLLQDIQRPSILFWRQTHFVVLIPQTGFAGKKKFRIADPAQGLVTLSRGEFLEHWSNNVDEDGDPVGFALSLEPTEDFFARQGEKRSVFSWSLVLKYFAHDHSQLFHVLLTIILSIAFQLSIPYLTSSLVDDAIRPKIPSLVTLIIAAQLAILTSRMIADFIRAKILLVISTFINQKMSADFWRKIMRLPLSYFENRRGGDIFQRISDNKQLQTFLTGPAVNTTFSALTCATFMFVLATYNIRFFIIFLTGMLFYMLWIRFFFNAKTKINHEMNLLAVKQNDMSLQFVQGINEIRIGAGEKLLLREWDDLQAAVFKLNAKSLRIVQIQNTGGLFISQGKDLLIVFLAANLVIEQKLTLGALLALQYVIGALASPIEQLIAFSQSMLDAKQSINRLNEVYQLKNENSGISNTPADKTIEIKGLSFAYPAAGSKPVLKNIDLVIPEGRVTAIVGLSGSGKTTLFKLLLRFYEEYQGVITVGGQDIRSVSNKDWRRRCGAVLQEGYIFNATIDKNIAVGEEEIDHNRLIDACSAANILTFITSLPNGFKTKAGVDGISMSQGQKQRLLIARALYKNPDYLFFDEATNALDAENERIIVDNLQRTCLGKTVVIIAHRLSTVKDADNIIVLHDSGVIEQGTHEELVMLDGKYLSLVRNQLELGV